jgi:hypothetical protein
MPYDTIRRKLAEYRQALERGDPSVEREALLDALDGLTAAIEADFTQVKAALSHLATLLEKPRK